MFYVTFSEGPFGAVALPYAENALEPFLSETTISTHYNKHHKGYAKKLNAAAKSNPDLAKMSLVEIIQSKDQTVCYICIISVISVI